MTDNLDEDILILLHALETTLQEYGLEIKDSYSRKLFDSEKSNSGSVKMCVNVKCVDSICTISFDYKFPKVEGWDLDLKYSFDWMVYNGRSSCISSLKKWDLKELSLEIKKYCDPMYMLEKTTI